MLGVLINYARCCTQERRDEYRHSQAQQGIQETRDGHFPPKSWVNNTSLCKFIAIFRKINFEFSQCPYKFKY
jgi:hypothetical protein